MSEKKPEQANDAAQSGAPDDVRAKFEEALQRKAAQDHKHNESVPASSKAHGAHGRQGHDRQFRRKSG